MLKSRDHEAPIKGGKHTSVDHLVFLKEGVVNFILVEYRALSCAELKDVVCLIGTVGSHCAKVNSEVRIPKLDRYYVDSLVTAVNTDILDTKNTNYKNPEAEIFVTEAKLLQPKHRMNSVQGYL